jgi:hypothetical protein
VFTLGFPPLRRCLRGFLLLGTFGLAVLVIPRTVAGQAQDGKARESVEEFCASDFRGAQNVEQRQQLVHFSPARVRELAKIMDGLSPYVFEWEAEPLEVVDSYKVGQVTVTDEEATVSVTYEVVAQRTSWGGRIERVPKKAIATQLRLRRYGNNWKVNDPPFPRVSKQFLSSSYRGIFDLPQSWYQNASSAQLIRLRNAIDTILLLDELR